MSRKCQITGRGPQVGARVSHAHNVTHRVFNINLQKVRVLVDGRVRRLRVSTNAIKSGLVVRPPLVLKERKKRVFETEAPVVREGLDAATTTVQEQPQDQYFMSKSVVSRIFKPKPKPVETEESVPSGTLSAEEIAQLAAEYDEQQAEGKPERRPNKRPTRRRFE